MTNREVALAGLEWFALLGAPASLIETARVELNEEDSPVAPDAGLAGPPADVADQRKPVRIELSPSTLWLSPGDVVPIGAMLIYSSPPPDYQIDNLIWSSSNSVVSVDKSGHVTASGVSGAPEKAEIKAFDPQTKLQGTAEVWVNALAPLALKITPASLELAPDESKELKVARVYVDGRPEDVTTTVQWTSSNPLVSVDNYGIAKAGGIGGDPVTVELKAIDPETNLTAKIEVVVKLPDDLTLEITPATVTLAPGGSAPFNAKRVDSRGRAVDVTAKVLWRSSSAAIAFDSNVAKARLDLTKSEAVDVTVTDLEMDLTTKVLVWVKVPSHEIRRFKTPFGQVLYFAGFEDQAKPRLDNASKSFLLAETSGNAMDAAYDKYVHVLMANEAALKNAFTDVENNSRKFKGEAVGAERSDIGTKQAQQMIDLVNGLIEDVKGHTASAEAMLKNAKDTTQLHELQSRIAAYNDSIDMITTSVRTISALASGNPFSIVPAVASEIGMVLKQTNSLAEDASKLQHKIDDEKLAAASAELDRASSSAARFKQQHEEALTLFQEAVENAVKAWKVVEDKYDTNKDNKGAFRFTKLKAVMDAAQAVLPTIPKAAEHADLAQRMANDLIYDRPHPDEWLADPKKDMETLRTLLSEALSKGRLAEGRQDEIEAQQRKLGAALSDTRKTMADTSALNEP